MIDTDEFERALRSALDADATRAPTRHVPWVGPSSVGLRTRPRRTARFGAIGVVAVASLIAVVTVGTRDPDSTTPSAFQPAGAEFAIVDLGPATRHNVRGVTLDEISRDIGVNGVSQFSIESGMEYQDGEAPVEVRCIGGDAGSSLCAPDYVSSATFIFATPLIGGAADRYLWAWGGLPTGTAYVAYVDGPVSLWQRPVDGIAAFPHVVTATMSSDGRPVVSDDQVAIAYSIDGVELGRSNSASRTADQLLESSQSIRLADLTPQQHDELDHLTQQALTNCLTNAGAVIKDIRASLPDGVDAPAVWDECVATTKAAVQTQVQALNVDFHDSNS